MTTQTKYRKYDSESDYYAMGYRMYSAEFGRFLAVDPLFEAMPRHNPYHYSFNSPMFWSDPSGLVPESLDDFRFYGDVLLEMVDKELAYIKSLPRYDAGVETQRPEETFQSREGGGGGNNGSFIGNIVSSVVNFFSDLFGGGDEKKQNSENQGFIVDNLGNIVEYNSDVNDCGIYYQDDEGYLNYLGEIGGTLSTEEIIDNILNVNTDHSKKASWYDFIGFYENVKGGGEWDYKNNKKSMFGVLNGTGTLFAINGYGYMNSEDFGNFHFGVIANAWGYSSSFASWGAGMYQIYSNTSPFIRRIPFIAGLLNGTSIGYIFIPPYGDDPWDNMRIRQGFNYYNSRYGE